jgi:protein gp37
MSTKSSIEWTEHTWNPTVGCTKISPGCKHCYAETMAYRLQAMGIAEYKDGFKLRLVPERLDEPLRRKKPTMYFVNSMSDLFHNDVPYLFLDRVFDVITQCPQHIFQILTKRADRMARYFEQREAPANAWLGVSVENRKHGVPRVAVLRGIGAKVRFLSVEPLLESLGPVALDGIHWVIVGGESGPKARPMDPAWAEEILRQCQAMGIPFFFKQWGAYGPDGVRRSKKENGRTLGNKEWNEFPMSSL